MITTIILSVLLAGSLVFGIIYLFKYKKSKQEEKKYFDLRTDIENQIKGHHREGYYITKYGFPGKDVVVYVNEIEKYGNNKSKIKFLRAECEHYVFDDDIKQIKSTFITVRDTNTITWLEEDHRIKKLERILNTIPKKEE